MTKLCKNCGVNFEIEDEDLKFYEKVSPVFDGRKFKIPEPVECPDCRQQRRLAFRNELNLYHNKCALCGKKFISIYSPDKPYKVYCPECFFSDKWDAMDYGREFDFERPFFEQFKELYDEVPKLGLLVLGDSTNSDYTHDSYRLKNSYLVFDGEQAQDCYYGETFLLLRDSCDFLSVQNSDLLYECVNCTQCYNVKYSRFCHNCSDSSFLTDCVGCKNCFMCANLHRKEYHIFNEPHSPEEYKEKIKSLELNNYSNLEKAKKMFEDFSKTQVKKAYRGHMNENVSGDNIMNCKNVHESFDCANLRDCKYCTNMLMEAYDCWDVDIWGDRLNTAYNCAGIGAGAQQLIGCYYCGFDSNNLYYSIMSWKGSHDIFGCVNLVHKKNCILNKQYNEDEYQKLAANIAEHMIKTGEWGQFFPVKHSSFGYNETVAQQFYPLTKEESDKKGYNWKEKDPQEYKKQTYEIPNDINEVPDSVVDEVLACDDCGRNYKIIPQELKFYKKHEVPVPRKCFFCRHKDRYNTRNPRKLWNRKCDNCGISIQTAYSPERPEKVYCGQCYLKEIV